MRFMVIFILMAVNNCVAQGWEAEITAGASGYAGDLTQQLIPVRTLQPAASFNIKYNLDNTVVLRAGLSWLNVKGNDKFNKEADLKKRNLNFNTSIWEGTICAEINLAEPDLFYAYPYLFGGVGLFHYDPYTYDNQNKKTYLQPLGTEGQGIPGYPNRKPYSLTQLCLPLGGGWKVNINDKFDIVYEFGYRILFTDYLDDVSTTYVNSQILLENKGPKTAELAYRQEPVADINLPNNGDTRGNPEIKDGYFFSGIKLLVRLGQGKLVPGVHRFRKEKNVN